MIMATTIIVKSGEDQYLYHVDYFYDFQLDDLCKLEKVTAFSLLRPLIKGHPVRARGLTDKDVADICNATNIIEGSANYNKFAGDEVYLFDLNTKVAKCWDRKNKSWRVKDE